MNGDKRYEIGEELTIDVRTEEDKDCPMMQGIGLVLMGGEEKTPGAKEGSDEEYAHKVEGVIEFKSADHLYMAEQGLKLIEKALMLDGELE